MLLTPGTGSFFCGSCLRDNALGRALRRAGHDVESVPLYLPFMLENPEEPDATVHMGGINMYLQQKSRVGRRLPRWVADRLDAPGLLRWVSKRGSMTNAAELGAMTVSMMRGELGNQAHEVEKLVEWIRDSATKPDIIVLSNVMLCGVARRLKEAVGVPVVVTMQGEAPFLDELPEEHREAAWRELRERASDVDAFVAVSSSYGEVMRGRLGVDADRLHVVHNGIEVDDFSADPLPPSRRSPRTIGYLARMCRDKGVHTLVEAFLKLAPEMPDVRLSLLGVKLNDDQELVDSLEHKVAAAGLSDRVTFEPNVDRETKLARLAAMSVMSVPATYGESFGLYLLEAFASGVPVVQPRHGAFPEVLEASGGGELCEPDDPDSLAATLRSLLNDPDRMDSLARAGHEAAHSRFTSDRMASNFVDVCSMLAPASDALRSIS